ncbi:MULTISPECIES: SRPBCC family protein [Streptomyces]|uniref:SRPBCC family protein n=1 Tax=Streptomyces TaxID=1883 RepID=UPI0007CD7DE4|nr:hypothetical protein A4V12_09625 [Streptomyces noursei]
MGTITLHAAGPASPDTVWQRYALLDEWPRWAPHIRAVHADGRALVAGLEGSVASVAGIRAAFVVESVDHDRREWTWRVRSGPLRLRLHHGVQTHPKGSATRLTMRGPLPVLAAYAPLARLALGRLVRT